MSHQYQPTSYYSWPDREHGIFLNSGDYEYVPYDYYAGDEIHNQNTIFRDSQYVTYDNTHVRFINLSDIHVYDTSGIKIFDSGTLTLYTSASPAARKFVVDEYGRVGVGMDHLGPHSNAGESPSFDLDVKGQVGVEDFIYHNDNVETYMLFGSDLSAHNVNVDGSINTIYPDDQDEINFRIGGIDMLQMQSRDVDHVESGVVPVHTQDHVTFNKYQTDVDLVVRSETNTGAFVVSGDGAEVVINEDGNADTDFRVESDHEDHMLFVDTSVNRISIGDSEDTPQATLEVTNDPDSGAFDVPLVQLNNEDTDKQLLDINAKNIDADVISVSANDLVSADVVSVTADSLTTGDVFNATADSLTTGSLIHMTHTGSDKSEVSLVHFESTGDRGDDVNRTVLLDLNFDTTAGRLARALRIDSEQTTGTVFELDAEKITTGNGAYIHTDSRTTGSLLRIEDTHDAGFATGSLVSISQIGDRSGSGAAHVMSIFNQTTANANARSLYIDSEQVNGVVVQIDASETTTGIGVEMNLNKLTTGTGFRMDMDSRTSGTGFHIRDSHDDDSPSSLVILDHTGDRSGTKASIGLDIVEGTTDNPAARALRIDSEQTTGDIVEIDGYKLTTGIALDISGADNLSTGRIANFHSNSGDTGHRDLVKIMNDNTFATGARLLHIKNDAIASGSEETVRIESTAADKNSLLELRNSNSALDTPPVLNFKNLNYAGGSADVDLGTIKFEGQATPTSTRVVYAALSARATDIETDNFGGVLNFMVQATDSPSQLRNMLSIGGQTNTSQSPDTQAEVVINEDQIDLDFRVETDITNNAFIVYGDGSEVVVNENGADTDFRVEATALDHTQFTKDDGSHDDTFETHYSAKKTHALYVNAENGRVGIGHDTPQTTLHVAGSAHIEGDLWVKGVTNQIDTMVHVTSSMDIHNTGTGPTLTVTQSGAQPVATFWDMDHTDTLQPALYLADKTMAGFGTIPTAPLHLSDTVQNKTNADPLATFLLDHNYDHGGIVMDSTLGNKQTHIRFAAAGDLKWQIRNKLQHPGCDAGELGIYSWEYGTDVMIFNHSGNVGIGTTCPGSKLQVERSDGTSIYDPTDTNPPSIDSTTLGLHNIYTGGHKAGTYSNIQFVVNGGENCIGTIALVAEEDGSGKGSLVFASDPGNNTRKERVRIKSNGNVGINTTAPQYRLQIAGDTDGSEDIVQITTNDTSMAIGQEQGLTFGQGDISLGKVTGFYQGPLPSTLHTDLASVHQYGLKLYSCSQTSKAGEDRGNLRYNDLAGITLVGDNRTGINIEAPTAQLHVYRADQHETHSGLTVHRGDTSFDERTTAPILNLFNGSSGSTEVFRVQGDGKVGIGTSSPSYGMVVSNSSTANSATGTMFIGTQLNGSGKGLVIDSTTRTSTDNAVLALEVINRAGGNTMAATVAGNVGIGHSTPDWALDVRALNTSVQIQLGRTGTDTGTAWMGADDKSLHMGWGEYGTNNAGGNTTQPNGMFIDKHGNMGINSIVSHMIHGSENTAPDGYVTPAPNLEIQSTDTTTALLRVGHSSDGSQGSGAIEVTQDAYHGGGISYNGDGNPKFAKGELSDAVTFYRSSESTGALDAAGAADASLIYVDRHAVFYYMYNNNDVIFLGNIGLKNDAPCLTLTDTTGAASTWHTSSVCSDSSHGNLILTADQTNKKADTSMSFRLDGQALTNESLRVENTGININRPVDVRNSSSGAAATITGSCHDDETQVNAGRIGFALYDANDHASNTTTAGYMYFETRTAGSTTGPSEKMRILANGTVGIGQTIPDSELHIGDSTKATATSVQLENKSSKFKIESGFRTGFGSTKFEQLIIYNTRTDASGNPYSGRPANGKIMTVDYNGHIIIGTEETPSCTLDIQATDAIQIPAGTSAERPGGAGNDGETGMIRYNSTLSTFEGFGTNAWGSLGGVVDTDKDTYIDPESSSDSDELEFFTAGTKRMTITSAGLISIGTLGTIDSSIQSATYALSVGGNIRADGDVIAFATSDKRYKDNLTLIDDPIDKINKIGGYTFDWNDDSEYTGPDVGVVAQEVEQVLPEVVKTRDNGDKAVNYEKMIPLLIECIKDQQKQIDEWKQLVTNQGFQQQKQIDELKRSINTR